MAAAQPIIGNYLIRNHLGRGAFGVVHKGEHIENGRLVALKLMDLGVVSRNPKAIQHVQTEISSMLKLHEQGVHPHILQIFELIENAPFEHSSVVCLVLEFAPKGELLEYLAMTQLFNEDVTRTYASQMLSGLLHCHQNGIVHRDLKPENLLLADDYRLKVSDFGLASFNAHHALNTICGTLSYMAPELLSGQQYLGQPIDVFAAGCIIFIMLTGYPPFRQASQSDWWYRALMQGRHDVFWQAHDRNVQLSDAAKDLITRMLLPDPAQRISVAAALQHPFFQAPMADPAALVQDMERRRAFMDQQRAVQPLAREAKNVSVVMKSGGAAAAKLTSEQLAALPEFSSSQAGLWHFRTGIAPLDGLDALDALLSSSGQLEVQRETATVTARLRGAGLGVAVVLRVQYHRLPESEAEQVFEVTVTKLQGDWFSFRSAFARVENELTEQTPFVDKDIDVSSKLRVPKDLEFDIDM